MTTDETWLRGDWMQTFTGRRFYPTSPRAEDVDPVDIAHALSLLCRYGGHTSKFYSVAEHCWLMSYAVEPQYALAALLHDATEAYVCDVPRPLKKSLTGYKEIENRVWREIVQRFGIQDLLDEGAGDSPLWEYELPAAVHEADNRILLDEKAALMAPTEHEWPGVEGLTPLGVHISGWAPYVIEREYLDRLEELLVEHDKGGGDHVHL